MQLEFLDDPSGAAPVAACAGGLLAGTLALMTCWATPEASGRLAVESQRTLLARKIVANLSLLGAHPDIPPGLRAVIGKVRERWDPLVLDASVRH